MKKIVYNLLLVVFVVSNVFSQQTSPGNRRSVKKDTSHDTTHPLKSAKKHSSAPGLSTILVPEITFNEYPINHNEHITSDGSYYYTINGGNASLGQINKFDLNGILIQTYPIQIDGRGLSYNEADGFLYASVFLGDIVKITDLENGLFETKFTGIMQDYQASFAISTDGSKFYDFYQGTLKVHDFNTGAVINTLTGLSFGYSNFGGEAAVAVDESHIYTCDATIRTVYVYDMSGNFIQTLELEDGDNGMALSIANSLLFLATDGDYSTGTWYGYSLKSLFPTCGNKGDKVLVCHKGKTICISDSAVAAHLQHGDQLGSCSSMKVGQTTLAATSEKLEQLKITNTPNPFSMTTKIFYELPSGGRVSLKIFDARGKEITTLANGYKQAGSYRIDFNASQIYNGLYYYRLDLTTDKGSYEKVGKMIVIK